MFVTHCWKILVYFKRTLRNFQTIPALRINSDINRSHVEESAKLKQIASPGNDREEEIDASKAF